MNPRVEFALTGSLLVLVAPWLQASKPRAQRPSDALATPSVIYLSQDDPSKDHALLPESYARKSAVKMVMPAYPEEAIRRGLSGLVRIKIEVSSEGEVLRIKVQPRTAALLKEAVVGAVKQWKFKPYVGQDGLGMSSISRLTFHFRLSGAGAGVKMYDPGPGAPDSEHLGYCNSAKEFREWREWEEVSIEVSH